MTIEEIRAWIERNQEGAGLTSDEIDHVAMCMDHIQEWYHNDRDIGSFLSAVVANNFTEVCFTADDVNGKSLRLYALFLRNHLPAD